MRRRGSSDVPTVSTLPARMTARRAPTVAAVAAVLVLTAVAFGRLLPPFDLLTFLGAGRDVLQGRSPYPSVGSAVFRSGHGFVYPVFVAWLFAPLAVLPRSVAEVLYGAASVAAIVVGCRLLGRRDPGVPVLVLVCSTTVVSLQMGTVNPFLLLGLAAAWHWRASRPLLCGVLLTVTAVAKLFLLPVLVWPVLRRRYATVGASVATLAALVVSGGLAGSLGPLGYLHLLSRLQGDEQQSSWSFSSLLQSLGLPLRASSTAVLVFVAGILLYLWARRRAVPEGGALGAIVVCCLLASPIVWSSYLLLLVVPVLLADPADHVLSAASLVTWLLVTPDAAPGGRVAVGLAAAGAAAVTVGGPSLRRAVRRVLNPPGALSLRRAMTVLAVAAVAALAAGGLWFLPSRVRSPLPALAAMALSAVACLRRRPRMGVHPIAEVRVPEAVRS